LGLLLHPLRLLLHPLRLRLRSLHLRLRLRSLHLRLRLRSLHLRLRLRPLHLRLRPLLLRRRRNYSWLSLRRPILRLPSLSLGRRRGLRSDLLLLLRVSHFWWLGARHLHLAALLTRSLNLLLRWRVPLLLVRNHLLSRGCPLRLLLLTQNFPLILLLILLLHLLAHTFALCLLSVEPIGALSVEAIGALLFHLLPPQILHLLPRVSITATRLSRQVCHLSLSCLLRRHVRLLARWRRALALRCSRIGSAFVSDLNLLIPDPVGEWLNPESLRQISSERWR